MKNKVLIFLIILLLFPITVLAYSDYIYPGGESIGIELKSDGVLVIGYYKVNNKLNNKIIRVGDYITHINDKKVDNITDLITLINKYQKDGKVSITVNRNNSVKKLELDLIKDNDIYITGLYVKDSITGIGTLTYVDPNSKIFGSLGHEIIVSETNKSLKSKDGAILESNVTSIDKSHNGTPGTKNARISNKEIGEIRKNTYTGIFGNYNSNMTKDLVKVGNINDLKIGKAIIKTVINKNRIKDYEIYITKIDKKNKIKNIYFKITDPELLKETGGIVQGMSGSPILQDNVIYGAVTHVVIDDVSSGYGVDINTMLSEGEK